MTNPTIFVGDLSAKVSTLPALRDALEQGDWIDVGATPHLRKLWAGEDTLSALVPQGWPTPNCWAHGAKAPTRRTYVLANRRALTMLVGITTGPWAQFDVHALVYTSLKSVEPTTVRKQRALATLHPDLEAKEHKELPAEQESAPWENQERLPRKQRNHGWQNSKA